ncbi:MAG: HAMP domain-containing histidine kinase [Lentisphaeria bacterium]|nr:HAMP domain-containing histidine kinase [Lentisphaeria bacterium]
MNENFEVYLKQVLQNSLVKPPEEMMEDCLKICITLASASGGSILAEEGPFLKFIFSNVPSLIGMNVPWDSIAGNTARESIVIFTYAPADKRHYDAIDDTIKHQTRYLLSIPIPSIHQAAEARERVKSAGVLQLLFNENIFPGFDVNTGAVEFSLQDVKEQERYKDTLQDVFWILPNISFGMEVMRLRQTSYQVIHELKNKLIATQSWLNCLKEDIEDLSKEAFEDETVKEDFELAESAAREGSKLAVNYLQLTKIYTPQVEDTDLNEVLRRTAADMRVFAADFSEHPIEIKLDLDDKVPLKRLDPDQLRMAFFNLCKNAVEALAEFRTENACLTIASREQPRSTRIDIADNGPGMPEEIASNLFTAFKTKKQGGTGLGLTICKKIIDIHGGNIRCETGAKGTRFLVEI